MKHQPSIVAMRWTCKKHPLRLQAPLKPCFIGLEGFHRLQFVHFWSEGFQQPAEKPELERGATIWVCNSAAGRRAVLYFDWLEMLPGTLCVADMLAIRSNVYPLNEAGTVVPATLRAVALAQAVYRTNWMGAVREHLGARRRQE
jgi:hypothetical protein